MTVRKPQAFDRSSGPDVDARRRFLKGLGVTIALPALESLPSRSAKAAEAETDRDTPPLRTAFVYVPNGAQQDNWFPSGGEHDWTPNRAMKPIEHLKDQLQVIAGLDHQHAEPGPDGAGDHARANATFLTGLRARKTSSANIRVGQSIDQFIAERIGDRTRFPSLELTCDAIRKSGRCDSGYSCAYQYNISWRTPVTPMAPEPNPRKVFERLFGSPDEQGARMQKLRRHQQQSVLDFVLDDARKLHKSIGRSDRQKVDQYLAGIRELEQRIERAENFPQVDRPDLDLPEAIPQEHAEHIELMFELLTAAFRTDSTRVATLLMAHDGSNRTFPELGIREGHHYLTHQQEEAYAREKVAQIDVFYMERFAAFLDRLRTITEPDGSSLLDHCMIVYGSGIADANRHTHRNLPVILAGGGSGTLRPGRYVEAPAQPMTNLFLSMVDRLGIEGVERFGDSTERLGNV